MDQAQQRLARLDKLEQRFVTKLRRAFMVQLEQLLPLVEQGAMPELVAAYVDSSGIQQVLSELYTRVIVAEAKREYDYLVANYATQQKASLRFGLLQQWQDRAKRFISLEGAHAIRQVTASTKKIVRNVLKEAVNTGMSIEQSARHLRQQVTAISTYRSRNIIRTELIGAANAGSLAGAASTGIPLRKVWLSTSDGRTRPTHTSASGQEASLDGVFLVGGSQLRFPADPFGTAAERCRCRCTMIYRPLTPRPPGA